MDFTGAGSAPASTGGGTGGGAQGAPVPAAGAPSSGAPSASPAAAPVAGGPGSSQRGGSEDVIITPPSPDSTSQEVSDAVEAIKIKLGDRELTHEEAQAEYNALMNRLRGADKTTAAYRDRAERASQIATQFQQMLIRAGMLSPDGDMVVMSPEQIKAQALRDAGQAPDEFKLPSFLNSFENDAEGRAFFDFLERANQEKGFSYAAAILLDRVDQVFSKFWEKVSGDKGYLKQQFEQNLAPMKPFFENLGNTKARADFLYEMQQAIGEDNQSLYPELQKPELLEAIVHEMDLQPKEWRHTPQGFEAAMNSLRWKMYRAAQTPPQPGGNGSGATPPAPRTSPQPPNVVVDGSALRGTPRPSGATRRGADDGSHLLTRKSVAGGIDWGR